MKRPPCPSNAQLDRDEMKCSKRKGHRGRCSAKLSLDEGAVTLHVEWWFTGLKKHQ